MNQQFENYIARLPALLHRLTSATALNRLDLLGIPKQGVYVFYEDSRAIYAGRSDNLKPYLMTQGLPSSNHYTASIAFGFAKKKAEAADHVYSTNIVALQDSTFNQYFDEEKERVARMGIRVVEVKESIEQLLLVVYASLELQTFNTFETH